MKFTTELSTDTLRDAKETASLLGYNSIKYSHRQIFTPEEFDSLNCQNHRARLGATLADIFPPEDCPRGPADISSVEYHMTTMAAISPVGMLLSPDGYIMLDGVHRLVAAYITSSPIHCHIYIPS